MTRDSFIQTSFRSGEWSAFSQGSLNRPEYFSAMNTCMNYIPLDKGALTRRPGTRFIVDAKDPTGNIKLIPFRAAGGTSYLVELTDLAIRFLNAGALVFSGTLIDVASISGATPAVVTTTSAHGMSSTDEVVFDPDATSASELFNRLFVITVLTTTTFSIAYAGSGSGSVDGSDICWTGGSVSLVREVTTPFASADITSVKYVQDTDTLYLFHKDYAPRILDGTTLTLSTMSFTDGPYFDEVEGTTTTLTPSGTTGSVTITASAITDINGGTGFQTTDVGRSIRLHDSADNWTWVTITARASTTSITVTINGADLADTSAVTLWRMGLYSDTDGWPTAGAFHEGRLWLASEAQEARVDGSRNQRSTNFTPSSADGTVADSHAVAADFSLSAQGRNTAYWMVPDSRGLLIGTDAGEWSIRASSLGDPISQTSIQARRVTEFGCADATPARVGKSTLFVQSLNGRVIDHLFDGRGYDGEDVSEDARQITSAGVAEIHFSKTPDPIAWCRTTDQRLMGMTYKNDKSGKRVGWHHHNINYTDDPDEESTGVIKSMAVLPISNKDSDLVDTLWLAVTRNGATRIEYLTDIFTEDNIDLEAFYVDSGIQYAAAQFGQLWEYSNPDNREFTFFGLQHLEGDTVDIVFRGADLGQQTVASGEVTVSVPDELLNSDGAVDFDIRVTADNFTFDSGYTSNWAATITSTVSQNSGASYIRGEDGNLYFLTNDSGGSPTTAKIISVATGATLASKTIAQFDYDTRFTGMNPAPDTGNDYRYDLGSLRFWALPDTPYFYIYNKEQDGFHIGHCIILYKINSDSEIEIVGGLLKRTEVTGDFFFNHVFAVGKEGQGRNSDQVLVAFSEASGTDDTPYLGTLPSTDAMTGTFTVDTTTADSFGPHVTSLVTQFDDQFWDTSTHRDTPYMQRAFFVPIKSSGSEWRTRLMSYVGRAEVQWNLDNPANVNGSPYIEAQGATYPNGFLVSVEIAPNTGAISGPFIENCNFRTLTDTSALPFSDAGDHKDGTTGDSGDDYMNPNVFKSNNDNAFEPWLLMWPRVYYNETPDLDPIGTYIGIRIMEWNPITGEARDTEFKQGATFDPVVDFSASRYTNNPKMCNIFWDRSTNNISYASVYTAGDSIGNNLVFADIGSYTLSSKTFDLSITGFDAYIGLNYKSRGQVLRPQSNRLGQALGLTRRVDQFSVLLHRAAPLRFGTDFTTMHLHTFTDLGPNGVRPNFSGVYEDSIASDYSFNNGVAWEQDRPGPSTVLAIGSFLSVNSR